MVILNKEGYSNCLGEKQIKVKSGLDIINKQSKNNNMNQNVKDIISGFVSGWTQVIIMQPFEIVKIRLQTQSNANPYYNGILDCFKKIAKEEGLGAFYKGTFTLNIGTVTPLIGIGFQASAMFFTY